MSEFEPNEWQQRVLKRIHVIDTPGQWGTCVHLSPAGKLHRVPEHIFDVCVPITDFHPDNTRKILQQPRLSEEEKENIRNTLISNRGTEYAFKPTANEQLKIDRIFVELTKHPEISYLTFQDRKLAILSGEENVIAFYGNKKPSGWYNKSARTIALNDHCFKNPYSLRTAVLEENLHSLANFYLPYSDFHGIKLTPVTELNSIRERAGQTSVLEIKLVSDWLAPTMTAEETAALAKLHHVHEAYVIQNPNFPGVNERNILATFRVLMQDIVNVYTDPSYYNAPKFQSEELYVKCLKNFILCRYRTAEMGALFLEFLELPKVAEGIREDHDKLMADYRTAVPEAERLKGALYAESVAKRVEAVLPGSTLYKFGRTRA